MIRAENSVAVVNLDNCPSLSAFCKSLLSIYLTMYLHVDVCQKIWGHSYFAFICMCKCSVNFSKFDIYTCKFSAVQERGGKKGGGGVTDKNCQKNPKKRFVRP